MIKEGGPGSGNFNHPGYSRGGGSSEDKAIKDAEDQGAKAYAASSKAKTNSEILKAASEHDKAATAFHNAEKNFKAGTEFGDEGYTQGHYSAIAKQHETQAALERSRAADPDRGKGDGSFFGFKKESKKTTKTLFLECFKKENEF